MLAELRDNFGTIQTLLSMLGFPILDPLVAAGDDQEDDRPLLHCQGKGADATGEYTEDGLVVYSESKARLDAVPSITESVQRRRENLQEEGGLQEENGALVFQQDHAFNSPSGAARGGSWPVKQRLARLGRWRRADARRAGAAVIVQPTSTREQAVCHGLSMAAVVDGGWIPGSPRTPLGAVSGPSTPNSSPHRNPSHEACVKGPRIFIPGGVAEPGRMHRS